MMDSYSGFARVYDFLQSDVNYDKWANQIISLLQKKGINSGRILELACGTANIGIRLLEAGYSVDGLDISSEMLSIAHQKTDGKMNLYNLSMEEFNLKQTYDAVICICDGMNYVKDLSAVMENVYNHLNHAGIFIFDQSSEYKLREVLGNSTIASTFEDCAYIWENEYLESEELLCFRLTIFMRHGEMFQRYEEFHEQTFHKIEAINIAIKKRFEILECLDGETFTKLSSDSERECYILQRKVKE